MGYSVISLDDANDPRVLTFELGVDSAPLTDREIEFRLRLGSAIRDARKISDLPFRRRIFERLVGVARSALTQGSGNLDAAEIEFSELRDELSAGLVFDRNRILYDVIKRSAPVLFLGLLFLSAYGLSFFIWGWIIRSLPQPNNVSIGISEVMKAQSVIGAIGYSFIGLYLGLILSSMIRARGRDGAETISALHFHGFSVPLYNFYMSALLITLIVILGFDILQIGVAGRLLNDFLTTPMLGLLVGAVCATGEAAISQLIMETLEGPDHRRNSS